MASEELFSAELSEEILGKQDDNELLDIVEKESEIVVQVKETKNGDITEVATGGK